MEKVQWSNLHGLKVERRRWRRLGWFSFPSTQKEREEQTSWCWSDAMFVCLSIIYVRDDIFRVNEWWQYCLSHRIGYSYENMRNLRDGNSRFISSKLISIQNNMDEKEKWKQFHFVTNNFLFSIRISFSSSHICSNSSKQIVDSFSVTHNLKSFLFSSYQTRWWRQERRSEIINIMSFWQYVTAY